MSIIKYFFEFLIIIILFIFFKILGLKFASYVGGKLGNLFGPFFRSNKKIKSNVLRAFPNLETNERLELPLRGQKANCGTLWTMAPELLRGKTHDASCDIWSLACVLPLLMAFLWKSKT